MSKKVVIFGAGGHAKVVINTIELEGRLEISFLADSSVKRQGAVMMGYPVVSQLEALAACSEGLFRALVAIGDNGLRQRIAKLVLDSGFRLVSTTHPKAVVCSDVVVGEGTLVMPNCVVNPGSVIGSNVIVNTAAVIEHDCIVGDHCHISPNATLCGGVEIGPGTLVGAGAVVLPGIKVGQGVVIGSGTIVTSNLPSGVRAVGNPARW